MNHGIPPDALGAALLDPEKQSMLAPLVDKVAFTQAINDAWAFVALTTLVVLIVVPLARRTARSEQTALGE
jgi:MFS transporter, DHA2 family, multidrug resistance protein